MLTRTAESPTAAGRPAGSPSGKPSQLMLVLRALILLLAVLVPLEVWLYQQWYQLVGQELREYLADLDRPTTRTKVLIVGDSHPHNAFMHTSLPDTVANVSFGSESLRDIHLKLTTLLRRGVKPRYVVLQADDHIFSPYRELTNNEQNMLLAADVADYNQVYGRMLSPVKQWGQRAYPLSDVRNRNVLVTLLIEKYLRGGSQGAAAVKPEGNQTWENMPAEARNRIAENRLHDQFGDSFTMSHTLQGTWENIIKLCHGKGIRVIAVRYPITDEYRSRLPRYDLSAVSTTLRQIAPDTLLDYSTLYAGQPQYFADSDHLSKAGSAAFGGRFQEDLARITAQR